MIGNRQFCGAEGARTPDPRLAKPVLSQLSYNPLALGLSPAPGRLIAGLASLRGTQVPLTSLLQQTLAQLPNLDPNPGFAPQANALPCTESEANPLDRACGA